MSKQQIRNIMGENIRNERLNCHLSLDELSELLEITPGFLGLIERGNRGVTALNLVKLSEILDVPIDTFYYSREGITLDTRTMLRKKLLALTANFNDMELNFIIMMAKGLYQMYLAPKP